MEGLVPGNLGNLGWLRPKIQGKKIIPEQQLAASDH
jgi:hypothetical protein